MANNSFAQIMASSLCTLDRFQYAPLRAFILKEVVRYLLSHVKVCVKSYRGIPTNRMHRMPTNNILYKLIMERKVGKIYLCCLHCCAKFKQKQNINKPIIYPEATLVIPSKVTSNIYIYIYIYICLYTDT